MCRYVRADRWCARRSGAMFCTRARSTGQIWAGALEREPGCQMGCGSPVRCELRGPKSGPAGPSTVVGAGRRAQCRVGGRPSRAGFAENAARQSGRLGTVADVEFREEAAYVGLDRVFADVKVLT